jgi:hypothetical protein
LVIIPSVKSSHLEIQVTTTIYLLKTYYKRLPFGSHAKDYRLSELLK